MERTDALTGQVRHVIWLVVAVGCATSPEAPDSTATFSAAPTATHARATPGNVNYGGALLHKWTVFLSAGDGCAADTVVSVELDTLSAMVDIPLGATPLRADQTLVGTPPSAFLSYPGATTTSGTVTIASATPSFIVGSLTAEVTAGGAPATYTGTFSAPVCAAL
jgi:hypothetical protein